MVSKNRLSCAGARDRGICRNRQTIRRDEVEARVLKAMEQRLWNDELFEEFTAVFVSERNRLHGEATASAANAAREQVEIEKQLARWRRWVVEERSEENDATAKGVRQEMAALERRKAELTAAVAAAERAHRARPLLHPEMGRSTGNGSLRRGMGCATSTGARPR